MADVFREIQHLSSRKGATTCHAKPPSSVRLGGFSFNPRRHGILEATIRFGFDFGKVHDPPGWRRVLSGF